MLLLSGAFSRKADPARVKKMRTLQDKSRFRLSARRAMRNKAGFTLLEALVALAILAGTTATVLSLLVANRSLQAGTEERLQDALWAEALLGQIGLNVPLNAGEVSGVSPDGRSWSITIAPFSDGEEPRAARARSLFEVIVRIRRTALSAPVIELRTLRRVPE